MRHGGRGRSRREPAGLVQVPFPPPYTATGNGNGGVRVAPAPPPARGPAQGRPPPAGTVLPPGATALAVWARFLPRCHLGDPAPSSPPRCPTAHWVTPGSPLAPSPRGCRCPPARSTLPSARCRRLPPAAWRRRRRRRRRATARSPGWPTATTTRPRGGGRGRRACAPWARSPRTCSACCWRSWSRSAHTPATCAASWRWGHRGDGGGIRGEVSGPWVALSSGCVGTQGYLGKIIDAEEPPLRPEQVSALFGNIEDIYELSR